MPNRSTHKASFHFCFLSSVPVRAALLCTATFTLALLVSACCCGTTCRDAMGVEGCFSRLTYTGPSSVEESPYIAVDLESKNLEDSIRAVCTNYCIDADPQVEALYCEQEPDCARGLQKRLEAEGPVWSRLVTECVDTCVADVALGSRRDFAFKSHCP